MSLEKFPHPGTADQNHQGRRYAAQSLPGSIDWPGESGSADGVRRDLPPSAPRTRSPRRRRWGQVLLALFLILVVTAAGTLFYLDRSFAGRIFPNIAVRGIAVGQLTPVDARAALEAQYAEFLARPLTLQYAGQTWTPTLAELGAEVDIDRAVAAAFAAGRGNGMLNDLGVVAALWESGLELPLHVTVDQARLQAYLQTIAAEVERPAVDAQLVLHGSTIGTTPAVVGNQVLINDTVQDVLAALQSLTSQTVDIRTREMTPGLYDPAVAAAGAEITRLLSGPLTLQAGDETFTWSVNELADLIQVEQIAATDGQAAAITVSIDRELVRERLQPIFAATQDKGEYPRVAWNGGDLQIVREGTPGQAIDIDRAVSMVMNALPTPDRNLNLPFRTIAPPVTADNLDQLGINELIGVGQSDFSGSAAYRVTNIKAGMNQLDGILLAPGDEFSFNDSVGAIDASNGFVEGYAIIQNRTQLEWGGGICQDSTTMFRAAFWAGLPITERWGHSFYISWYDRYGYGPYGDGPGMDATIFIGGPDLKFVNDTEHWILIDTLVDTSRRLAEVRLYGTSDGREVELAGGGPVISNRIPAPTAPVYVPDARRPRGSPRQSDTARGGMTITFTRIVKLDGAVVNRDDFVTRFRPWPNIFEIHPDDLGPDGRPLPAAPPPEETALPEETAPPGEQPPDEQPPGEQPPAEEPVIAPPPISTPEPLPSGDQPGDG